MAHISINPEWLGASSDHSQREEFERALDVAGAGAVLLQTFINRVVQSIENRELGVHATLPRDVGSGDAAHINDRTPGTAPIWVLDSETATEATGTYNQTDFTYKTLLTRGQVTRKLVKRSATYGDALAIEMNGRVGDFSEELERTLLQGSIAADPQEFDGLITQAQVTASQIVVVTTVAAGDTLTPELMDEAVDAVKGASRRTGLLIFASRKGRRLLNAMIAASHIHNDKVEVDAGFRVRSYDGIPIITTTGMPDDLLWDGSTNTAFTGGVTTSIIVVNTEFIRTEELTAMTVMPLARRSSQFHEFDIFWDGVLTVHNPLGLSILGGIATG